MIENSTIEKIKKEIELKREELNMTVDEGLDRNKILIASQELDMLIVEYYSAFNNKKQQN